MKAVISALIFAICALAVLAHRPHPHHHCAHSYQRCGHFKHKFVSCCNKHDICKGGYYKKCIPKPRCAGEWEQCGGKGWKGPFCCKHGLKCVYFHKWYSQCKSGHH